MTLTSHAVTGAKWTGSSAVVTAVTEVLRTIVLARLLSPADFGLVAMAMIVIGFAQMYTDLGVSAAIIYRQDATKRELSSLYWLNIVTGLAVFGLVWFCNPLVLMLFREPRLLPLLKVVAAVFVIAPIGSQFEILLQKELSFKALAGCDILASLGNTAVAITCALSGFGAWALVYGYLTSVVLKTLLLARIGFSRFRPSFHFSRSDLKGYIAFGLFQTGERSVNYLGQRFDQMLIGSLLGAQALGFYSFAFNLAAQPISRLNPILTKVAFPLFSKVQHDPGRLRKGYIKLLSFIATLNAPLLIGLAAVAPWAVPAVFGLRWSQGIVLIQILSFVTLARSMGNPIGSLLLAKGRADLGFWWNVVLLACTAPAIYAGARIGHVVGVAVALLALQISVAVPAYFYLVRPLIGKCAQDYSGSILKPIAVACLMGIIVILLPGWHKNLPALVALSTQVGVGAIVYIGLLMVFHQKVLYEFRSWLFSH